ncbi:ribosome biogenesis protein WDR12 homolog [Augochlora pura]
MAQIIDNNNPVFIIYDIANQSDHDYAAVENDPSPVPGPSTHQQTAPITDFSDCNKLKNATSVDPTMKKTYRRQRFHNKWFCDAALGTWVQPVDQDCYKAKCIACRTILVAGRSQLLKHSNTVLHKENMIKAKEEGKLQELKTLDDLPISKFQKDVRSYASLVKKRLRSLNLVSETNVERVIAVLCKKIDELEQQVAKDRIGPLTEIELKNVDKYVSTEELMNVEPESHSSLIHNDWVSAFAVCEKWIITACDDNTLHIWSYKGTHCLETPGLHTALITALAWISQNKDVASFVSASIDGTARIWSWNITENFVECIHVCRDHKYGIEAVSVNYDETIIATAGQDRTLKLWSTFTHDENENDKSTSECETKVHKRTMKGHEDIVSSLVWSDDTEIISSSRDHKIIIWDSELGEIKHELIGHDRFFDIDYSPLCRSVITASYGRHIRLYDPRYTEGTLLRTLFTSPSQTQRVLSVRWSPVNEHLFISAGDNMQVWDTRNSKAPLFDLLGNESSLSYCDWLNPKFMVFGGKEKVVRIFKSEQVHC